MCVRTRLPSQNVIEYGIIIVVIAMVVLLGVAAFVSQLRPWFRQLASHITTIGTETASHNFSR